MATLHFVPQHEEEQVYSISGKALKLTTSDDIKPYLEELAALKTCTKLDLSGNTIGTEASEALAKCIAENTQVRESLVEVNFADLYTSRLVDEVVDSLKFLLPVLLKCPHLEIVNLSDNAFGLRTIELLEDYIANAVNIKHLILSNNGMGPFAGERIGKALFHLAQNKKAASKPFLETFICGRNRLENGSAVYLALGLKSHSEGLKVVKLYQNGIRPKGVATLIHYGLQYLKNLEILDLQDNTFTKHASLILAKALPTWKDSLFELNLNDCLLKTAGSDEVFKVFTKVKFPNLHVLKFEYNEMAQETIEVSFLPAMEKGNLPELEKLEINGNRLDEDSDALDLLQSKFDDLEVDDFEEVDSEDEEGEDEEDEDEDEKLEEIETERLEKELLEVQVDDLAERLAETEIK
ncbi:Rna1p [Saccharomyces cerevisiae YJM1419]|nr:Rna1p [Saccharomyces cerevisiae YJM1419]